MDAEYIVNKLVEYGVPLPDAKTLAAVGYAESGYRPGAVGDNGDSLGLFQINIPAHWDKLARWTGSRDRNAWEDWLKNPDNNIMAASQVYRSQGLGAWTMYTNGGYKQYLDQTLAAAGADPAAPIVEGGTISQAPADPWYAKAWSKFTSALGRQQGDLDPKEELEARKWVEDTAAEKGIPISPEFAQRTQGLETAWKASPAGQRESTAQALAGIPERAVKVLAGLVLVVLGVLLMAREGAVKLVKEAVT